MMIIKSCFISTYLLYPVHPSQHLVIMEPALDNVLFYFFLFLFLTLFQHIQCFLRWITWLLAWAEFHWFHFVGRNTLLCLEIWLKNVLQIDAEAQEIWDFWSIIIWPIEHSLLSFYVSLGLVSKKQYNPFNKVDGVKK